MITATIIFLSVVIPYMLFGLFLYGAKVLKRAYKNDEMSIKTLNYNGEHWVQISDDELFKYTFFWPAILLSDLFTNVIWYSVNLYHSVLVYIFRKKVGKE